MPKSTDKHVKCPEYEILNSKDHLRKMLKEVREKVFAAAHKQLKHIKHGAIVLQGGKEADFELYDTDVPHCNFRQEAFFRYVFGLNEPNALGILDLERKE
ncbi:hypothetical protein RFI_31488, partial [Reticulomyxa filosa]